MVRNRPESQMSLTKHSSRYIKPFYRCISTWSLSIHHDILRLVDTDFPGKVWGERSSQGGQDEQQTSVFSLFACHWRFSACSKSTWLFLTLGTFDWVMMINLTGGWNRLIYFQKKVNYIQLLWTFRESAHAVGQRHTAIPARAPKKSHCCSRIGAEGTVGLAGWPQWW